MQHSYVNRARLITLFAAKITAHTGTVGDSHRHSDGEMSTTELNIDLRTTASFF